MKFFNGKKIELLAPSGTPETFRDMLSANCDAIYLGGEQLNMRLMRKGYNFSDEQIVEAVRMARDVGKQVYVTVNNMISERELPQALRFLEFLNRIPVDAIIIQDLGLLTLCQTYGFNQFALHTSVMMNLHNLPSVRELQTQGVSRVILPREMDLQRAKYIQAMTGIETEYFIHGDMCIANGANCYYSSMVFGNSSNRGRCFKPCRWSYQLKKDGRRYQTEFPLAAKDMSMYEYIPELIDAGIMSFKIEGRMREKAFILNLVNTYGEAIDRYLEDPLAYDRGRYSQELFDQRKRDFTTAYAFGRPGLDYINTRYEGTGKFYSTGKVFSTPTPEPLLDETTLRRLESVFVSPASSARRPLLSIKVNNLAQAELALEKGVARIYLPMEVFAPDSVFTLDQLAGLYKQKGQVQLYLETPQMMKEQQIAELDQYLSRHGAYFDGLVVSSPGLVRRYADRFAIQTSFNLNLYNSSAVAFYQQLGAAGVTLSIESTAQDLRALLSASPLPLELIVHGPLKVMYLDHDLYENTTAFAEVGVEDNRYISNAVLVLISDQGETPVYRDQYGHNHLMSAKELCLLPLIPLLSHWPVLHLRIEAQTYTVEELSAILTAYHRVIADPEQAASVFAELRSVRDGFTLGALSF